eukprot:jgi/Mesen1/10518/ME000083S10022
MCGRTRCTLDPDAVALRTAVPPQRWLDKEKYSPSYNVSPGHYTPILKRVQNEESSADHVIHCMKWGLVPSFTKNTDKPDHFRMFNARSETVRDKASFRRLIPHSRCVALVEGFYEWKKDGSKKQPYYLHLESGEPLQLAALYDCWENAKGERLYTYTILTTRVTKALEWLHDRMPVILGSQDSVKAWLDGELPAGIFNDLTKPYAEPDLVWYPVTPAMGKPSFDNPECIKELKPKQAHTSTIADLFTKRAVNPSKIPLAKVLEGERDLPSATNLPEATLTGDEKKAFEAGVLPDRDVSSEVHALDHENHVPKASKFEDEDHISALLDTVDNQPSKKRSGEGTELMDDSAKRGRVSQFKKAPSPFPKRGQDGDNRRDDKQKSLLSFFKSA